MKRCRVVGEPVGVILNSRAVVARPPVDSYAVEVSVSALDRSSWIGPVGAVGLGAEVVPRGERPRGGDLEKCADSV